MPWLSVEQSDAENSAASILKLEFNIHPLAFSTMAYDFGPQSDPNDDREYTHATNG